MANEQHVNRRRFLGYGAAAAGGRDPRRPGWAGTGRPAVQRAAEHAGGARTRPLRRTGPGADRRQPDLRVRRPRGSGARGAHQVHLRRPPGGLRGRERHGRRHARLRPHRGADPHQPDRLGRHRRRRVLRRPGRQGRLARADRLQHPRPVAVARGRGPGVLRARRRRRPPHGVEHHAGLRRGRRTDVVGRLLRRREVPRAPRPAQRRAPDAPRRRAWLGHRAGRPLPTRPRRGVRVARRRP